MSANCTQSAISAEYDRVSTPLLSSISAVSLLLNACNIAIFSKRKMVSPTNSILLAIAVSDLCKVSMFLLITAAPPPVTSYGRQVIYLFCNVAMFLMHAFALWCGVLLALFRFFYLCFYASPHTKVWFSLARSRLAVCLAFLANIGAVVPYASVLRVIERRTVTSTAADGVNATALAQQLEQSVASPESLAIHYEPAMLDEYEFKVRMFSSIAQKLVPCLIMTVFCLCIIRSLRQTEKRRESLANPNRNSGAAASAAPIRAQKSASSSAGGSRRKERRSRDHRRTTSFLLIIMLLYSLYEIPMGLLLILSDPAFQLSPVICFYQAYHGILNTLGLVNNTVNFVLYCFMSKQFRDTFKEVFGLNRLVEKVRKMTTRRQAPAVTAAGATAAAATAARAAGTTAAAETEEAMSLESCGQRKHSDDSDDISKEDAEFDTVRRA